MGRRVALIGTVVVCAVALGAGVALRNGMARGRGADAAATGWVIETTPVPSDSSLSELVAVSCPSSDSCFTVGERENTSGRFRTLAEQWNGTSWTIRHTLNPATQNSLSAVSCASAAACVAVGQYQNRAGAYRTLAEYWDSTGVSVQPTRIPSGAVQSALSGVSCPSDTACVAVGQYETTAGRPLTLAERWDGTSWAIQPTPNPTGATLVSLAGVSCSSRSACMAVGTYENGSGDSMTLAERWDGSSWRIQPTPNPHAATSSALSGVSCTSSRACVAVGQYDYGSNVLATLAERWDGSSWILLAAHIPVGATASQLAAVSCASASWCIASGNYVPADTDGGSLTLAEIWNGASWAIERTPDPAKTASDELAGSSCSSPTACIVVGGATGNSGLGTPLAEKN